MSGIVVSGHHRPTKLQEELLAKLNKPETYRRINEIIAEAAEKYVPTDSGELATDYTARVDGILYHQPYARYQYEGKVMGPNVPHFDKFGEFTGGWHTPKGKKKYLTGGIIGDGTVLTNKKGEPFYVRHYTKEGTGDHWIIRMWNKDSRKVQNKITRYLKDELK